MGSCGWNRGGERVGEERVRGVWECGDDMADTWRVCGGPRRVRNVSPENLVRGEGVELRARASCGSECGAVEAREYVSLDYI